MIPFFIPSSCQCCGKNLPWILGLLPALDYKKTLIWTTPSAQDLISGGFVCMQRNETKKLISCADC
jgi:hypothetical protein